MEETWYISVASRTKIRVRLHSFEYNTPWPWPWPGYGRSWWPHLCIMCKVMWIIQLNIESPCHIKNKRQCYGVLWRITKQRTMMPEIHRQLSFADESPNGLAGPDPATFASQSCLIIPWYPSSGITLCPQQFFCGHIQYITTPMRRWGFTKRAKP